MTFGQERRNWVMEETKKQGVVVRQTGDIDFENQIITAERSSVRHMPNLLRLGLATLRYCCQQKSGL
jgi:hypothetical protein